MKRNVACIGVGNVGRSWAIVFACAGGDVAVYDSAPDFSDGFFLMVIKKSIDALANAGLIASGDEVLARIHLVQTLGEAVS